MASTDLEVIFKGEDRTLSRTASSVGRSFSGLGKAVAGGLALGATAIAGLGAATIGLGSKLISLGSDAEEMQGKFDVVFANTSETVTDALGTFADEVGRSRFELMEMASTFGDTLKPMGFTEDAAAEMSITLSQLATDLGSFNNMSMDEAMQRLQGTLIGSHENALAFGVIINENTLSAKLAEMGLDDLTGAALEQAKVQARMALLMEGTTDAQGDAARTSMSWANQTRALVSKLKDFGTELGLKLLPIFTPLLTKIGELVENLMPKFEAVLESIIPFLNSIGIAISQFFTAVQFGQDPIDAFLNSFLIIASYLPLTEAQFENLGEAVFGIKDKLIALKDQFLTFIEPIVAWIQQNIQLKDVLIALGIVLGGVVLSALVSLAAAVAPILLAGAALIGLVALIRTAWEENWGGIQEKTAIVVEALKGYWENTLLPAIQGVWAWMKDTLFPWIQDTLLPLLSETFTAALTTLSTFWTETLQPAIEGVWTWMKDTLWPWLTDTAIPFLESTFTAAIQTLSDYWTETLQPALQAIYDFLFIDMMPIWESLGEFFDVAFTTSLTAIAGVWENVLLPALTAIYDYVNDTLGPILDWLKTNIVDPLKDSFSGLGDTVSIVADFIDGLTQKLEGVELPWWMTPGSPTPWENGLKGVRTQLKSLYAGELPALNTSLQGLQSVTNRTTSVNQVTNIYTSQVDTRGESQANMRFALGGI